MAKSSALVIVLRRCGFFHTGEFRIYHSFDGWNGFGFSRQIPAVHKGDGWGVFLRFVPSQLDLDFAVDSHQQRLIQKLMEKQVGFYWTPSVEELQLIRKAFDYSDYLTFQLLKRGWKGKRPCIKLWEMM